MRDPGLTAIVLALVAIVVAACVAPTAAPVPTTALTAIPPTVAPATVLPTAMPPAMPTATLSPLPPTVTPSPLPPTATAVPPTPTITPMPDPIYARADRVSGVVAWHGMPVGGIPVDLYSASGAWCVNRPSLQHTFTDGQGRYVFLDVSPGTYWLGINSSDFREIGFVKPYTWICGSNFNKTDAAIVQNWDLSKTDLKIVFPSPGISFNNTQPTFSWEPYPDAAYYTVMLDWMGPTWQRVESDTRTDTLSFMPKAPLVLGKYKLRVSAWDSLKRRFAFGDVDFAVQ